MSTALSLRGWKVKAKSTLEITHYQGFCGSGGGGHGFNTAEVQVGGCKAKFRALGGFDVDPKVCRDFTDLVGVPATPMDLFTLEDFRAFHSECVPGRPRRVRRSAPTAAIPANHRRAGGKSRTTTSGSPQEMRALTSSS